MSAENVRTWLDEHLTPLLPNGWRWVPYQRNLDALDAVTVTWKQSNLRRLAEAPVGTLRVEGVLTIASPHQDIDRSEEQLDAAVLDLVQAIDALPGLAWTDASKVAVGDQYLGWDITVWTTASLPAPTPDPAPKPDPESE